MVTSPADVGSEGAFRVSAAAKGAATRATTLDQTQVRILFQLPAQNIEDSREFGEHGGRWW
jgi:hypothetical protein